MNQSIHSITKVNDIDTLKSIFPDGKADRDNFCLFSTSGIHGTYLTIEDLFPKDDEITVLIIQPRLVNMRYGHIKVEKEDINYLKKLRKSSIEAVSQIGF